MKHTDKPGGRAVALRPLTKAEKDAVPKSADIFRNPSGGCDMESGSALLSLEAVGFFAPPPDKHNNGRAWNDSMLRVLLLRAISARRDLVSGRCFPSYETTAADIGMQGGISSGLRNGSCSNPDI